jgi:tetrahydromethanopterin S-methyltransferase subunit C
MNTKTIIKAMLFFVVGLSIAILGFYLGEVDDAPGLIIASGVVAIICIIFGVKAIRSQK